MNSFRLDWTITVDFQLFNRIFFCTLLLSAAYYCISVFVDKCSLPRGKRRLSSSSSSQPPFKWRATVRAVWSISFYLSYSAFLVFYHYNFVQPDVDDGRGRYFQYESVLFFLSDCNQGNFKNIFVTSLAFHLLGTVLQVREAEYADAVTRFLFTAVLVLLYTLRFEHYFIGLCVIIGLYQAVTCSLFLIALHSTNQTQQWVFDLCAALHFVSWSYVFLALLPFDYLLPTLYMKPFSVCLNVFCWMWYGNCVWNSPVLQVLYHQTFHTVVATEESCCLGGGNVAKCLLLRETKEMRHLKCLRRTVEELKAVQSRSHSASNSSASSGAENQSAKALQTLKCVMTLKRKLKRMREAKAAAAAAAMEAEEAHLMGSS